MIHELTWDSDFFKKKIGELRITSASHAEIERAVQAAREAGYRYILCKVSPERLPASGFLESIGFYLSDIGITFTAETEPFLSRHRDVPPEISKHIVIADTDDIPALKTMVSSLFTTSRFYSDPFFTKDEADRLFQAWAENAVKKDRPDIVFCIPHKGLVSGMIEDASVGKIGLMGVMSGSRGKGLGEALMLTIADHFKRNGIDVMDVRTQLRNSDAMHFYMKLGFSVKEYDVTFSKIL